MRRRTFLQSAGLLGAASFVGPAHVLAASRQSARYFDLHPFLAAHPEAVFIQHTTSATRYDEPSKKEAGLALARQLFRGREDGGTPLSHKIALKPNMAGPTDASFVEGLIEGMKELGLAGEQFYLREGNVLADGYHPNGDELNPFRPVATRTGARLNQLDSGRQMYQASLADLQEGTEVIWKEVPGGVIFRRLGYVAPTNAPDAWNLSVAKLKAHGMGLTLCSKNWQGTTVVPHIHFCERLDQLVTAERPAAFVADVNPEYLDNVTRLHAQHLQAGVPRWDRPGSDYNSGWGMEGWAQKTVDNLSVSPIGVSIIEGIWAGNALTHVLLFGINPVKVDIIGHWLGGHEPGNFGFFHAARDRGLTDQLNPRWIPVYDWNDGVPALLSLEDLARTPIPSYYLRRDYGGQTETEYHLVNEPFDYGTNTAVLSPEDAQPGVWVLRPNYPNPFNEATLIEYRLPKEARVRLEVRDTLGQVVDVLVDGRQPAGAHVAAWSAPRRASGTYFCRLLGEGFEQTRRMTLLR